MSALIIAGFHRSGTSAVARSFHLGGLFLGEELLGSEPSNPYGHFEDKDVIDIHQDLLEVNRTDWKSHRAFDPIVPDETWARMRELVDARNALGKPWGFKDPRVCLFLPLWLHLVPDAQVFLVYRNPAEAIRSLHMRHSRQLIEGKGRPESHLEFWQIPDLGARMWLHYHQTLLRSLPDMSRVHVVHFGDRVAVSRAVTAVNDRWDLGLTERGDDALDPGLGAQDVDPVRVVDAELASEISAMWTTLGELADQSSETLNGEPAT